MQVIDTVGAMIGLPIDLQRIILYVLVAGFPIAVILAWGTADPDADLDGSGEVDVLDLVQLVLAWGPCSG